LALRADIAVLQSDLVEHLAHKGLARERVGLVEQGDMAGRAVPLSTGASLGEGELEQLLAGGPRDRHSVADALVAGLARVVATGE
jgi:hypothetical protein